MGIKITFIVQFPSNYVFCLFITVNNWTKLNQTLLRWSFGGSIFKIVSDSPLVQWFKKKLWWQMRMMDTKWWHKNTSPIGSGEGEMRYLCVKNLWFVKAYKKISENLAWMVLWGPFSKLCLTALPFIQES
jgi:hypothetical protein